MNKEEYEHHQRRVCISEINRLTHPHIKLLCEIESYASKVIYYPNTGKIERVLTPQAQAHKDQIHEVIEGIRQRCMKHYGFNLD